MLSANRQLFILLSLYIAQGLPFGFFTQAMPAIMRESGVELRYIGLMSLLALPWALKFLWAPVLDRYAVFGLSLRKGWILLANGLALMSLLVLSSQPQDWWLGAGIVFTMFILISLNLFAASQDISTDALAVESVPAEKRGWINGIQVSGYRVGMVIGGGAVLAWLPVLGWQYSMWIMALIMMLTSLPVLFMEDNKAKDSIRHHSNSDDHDTVIEEVLHETMFQSWKGLLSLKGIGFWIVLLILYKAGDSLGTAMLKPLLVDRGYELQDIALIIGTWGVLAGFVGAFIGGILVKPLGRIRALILFAALQSMSLFLYGLYANGSLPESTFVALCVLEHVTGAMATIGIFTVMMDYCREQHAGLDYSFQACIVVIGGMSMAAVSGFSVEAFGYGWHFIIASALTVLAALVVIWRRSFIASLVKP
mgnify:CR=1 FL=1